MSDNQSTRIALVTGGGRGIGREIATMLGASGITVCISARTKSQIDKVVMEITSKGGIAFGYQADMENLEDLDLLVEEITNNVGTIDILVNNAGVGGIGLSFWEDDPRRWWQTLEINLRGPMVLTHKVIKGMITKNRGTIINVSSFAGVRPTPLASAYSVSKAAITRFTDNLAASLLNYNIGVFAISPGLVYTEMTKDVPIFKSLPQDAWTPIEKTPELVMKLISGDYNKLSGKFIHVSYNIDELLDKSDQIIQDQLYILRLATLSGLEE